MRAEAVRAARPRLSAAAWGGVAIALVLALAPLACTETRRPLGEDCLKSDDCLSGVCSGLKCVALPPLLDGAPERVPDGAVVLDAGASEGGATEGGGGDSAPGDAAEGG